MHNSKKRNVGLLLGAGALGILVVVVYFVQRPLRIEYHRTRMLEAHSQLFSGGFHVSPGGLLGAEVPEDAQRRYEYHRDQLVSLGHYFHARYAFDHIEGIEGAHGELWRRVVEISPDNPCIELTYPNNDLLVWDRPDRRGIWESFVDTHNIRDFEEKFMK